MKQHKRIHFLLAALLATALQCPVQGQPGPQDHWVLEPDLVFGPPQLSSPGGIAVDDQSVFVVTVGGQGVLKFTRDGTYTNRWGNFGSADGQYQSPQGVALDRTNVFVTDSGNNRIQVFDKQGTFLRKWEAPTPGAIAVDENDVYVGVSSNRVQVYGKNGTYLRQWGSTGGVLGEFNGILGLAVDQQWVYVLDSLNIRVQVFAKDGTFVRSWPLPPQEQSNLSGGGIAVDAHAVYVTYGDYYQGPAITLLIYDKYGGILLKEGGIPAKWSERYPLQKPTGIALCNPFLFVVDSANIVRDSCLVQPFRRIYRTLGPLQTDAIPLTDVLAVTQRNGAAVLDVDYQATDENDSNVTVYAAAFVVGTNSMPSLNDVVPMRTFLEGTATNIGPGVSVGGTHRLSWDMGADGVSGKIPQWGDLKVSLMAKDQRGLLDFHFLSVPAIGTNTAFKINRDALLEPDFLPLWFWWLGAGDTNLALNNGQVTGVGGAFDGQLLARGTNTTDAGRAFIYSRVNVREATTTELQVAREGTTPGTVQQWEPRREPPAAGAKVNALNFVTYPTNGWWVVPLQ